MAFKEKVHTNTHTPTHTPARTHRYTHTHTHTQTKTQTHRHTLNCMDVPAQNTYPEEGYRGEREEMQSSLKGKEGLEGNKSDTKDPR